MALSLSLAWTLLGSAQAQTIREDDFQRLVGLDSPAVAPDGTHAAVVVTRILWNDDARSSELVLVDLTTRARQTLITGREGLSDPAFSPDGTRLAFLAKNLGAKERNTQIFVMPAGGGEAQAVTHDDAGVAEFLGAPTGARSHMRRRSRNLRAPVPTVSETASSSPPSRSRRAILLDRCTSLRFRSIMERRRN